MDYLNYSLSVHDIAQIDILNSGVNTGIFGIRGAGGVLVVHTKQPISSTESSIPPFHIKTLLPLGYQQPEAFYAPKYETEAQRSSPKPDLRTTIHWQPVVQINSVGEASFEFYSADDASSYTVVIEGLADDGTIIRKEEKIKVSEG
jgi:hypothetical protein